MPPDRPGDCGPDGRWGRVTTLFLELVDLEPDVRQGRLESAAMDPNLRREVERLLAGHAAARDRFPKCLDPVRTSRLLEPVGDSFSPGTRIGPYEIERQLGRGGMGVVYLARDTRLGRLVALKIPPSYLAFDSASKRRITAEARAASALDHPRIATIYDIGETDDGRLYIAMAYCEGKTLAEILESEPIPIGEAVSIGAQIAEALSAAHAQGIIHRDIKPGNVMVAPDGSVRLVDFGIAQSAGGDHTGASVMLGTVGYMSPEQTRGRPVDSRTDLWSLGVVLYEMLAGRHPFPAATAEARIHAIRHDDPADLTRLRPEIGDDLVAIVECCLARDPTDRPKDAGRVSAALALQARAEGVMGAPAGPRRPRRSQIGVVALIALALAGATIFLVRDDGPPPEPSPESIWMESSQRLALLPFLSLGADTTAMVLAAGLSEDLGGRLSRIEGIRVIARGSVEKLVTEEVDLADIGSRLDVDAVIEGTLQRSERRVRVAVRLLDPRTGTARWESEYETLMDSLPEVGNAIVEQVAATLEAAAPQGTLTTTGTDIFDAYLHYLRGRYYWSQRTAAGIERSMDHFERALDLDPAYAKAWSGLADAHIMMGATGMMKAEDALPRAHEAAQRALEIDPYLATAHSSLGAVLADYYWDWQGAERAFRRAIELDPSDVSAHYWYSELLAHLGRTDEAIAMARRAREADPLSQLARADEGRAYYLGRRYEEALTIFHETLDLGPQFVAQIYSGLAYSQLGRHEEAIAAMESLRTAYPRFPEGALLAYVLARAGQRAEAERILQAAQESEDMNPVVLAAIHSGMGNLDMAFENLERAYESRAWQVVMLKQEPAFDPLRDDPRYADLLDRLLLD